MGKQLTFWSRFVENVNVLKSAKEVLAPLTDKVLDKMALAKWGEIHRPKNKGGTLSEEEPSRRHRDILTLKVLYRDKSEKLFGCSNKRHFSMDYWVSVLLAYVRWLYDGKPIEFKHYYIKLTAPGVYKALSLMYRVDKVTTIGHRGQINILRDMLYDEQRKAEKSDKRRKELSSSIERLEKELNYKW